MEISSSETMEAPTESGAAQKRLCHSPSSNFQKKCKMPEMDGESAIANKEPVDSNDDNEKSVMELLNGLSEMQWDDDSEEEKVNELMELNYANLSRNDNENELNQNDADEEETEEISVLVLDYDDLVDSNFEVLYVESPIATIQSASSEPIAENNCESSQLEDKEEITSINEISQKTVDVHLSDEKIDPNTESNSESKMDQDCIENSLACQLSIADEDDDKLDIPEKCTCELIQQCAFEDEEVCQAVDSIDDNLIGCCQPVETARLVRSLPSHPLAMMCEMHLWKMKHHLACPSCGHFCSQGTFMHCSHVQGMRKVVHLFHKSCQSKSRQNKPICLHCGATEGISLITYDTVVTPLSLFPDLHSLVLKRRMGLVGLPKMMGPNVPKSERVFKIPSSGKTLCSDGLPTGCDKNELDEYIEKLQSKDLTAVSYDVEDFYVAAIGGNVNRILEILALGFDPNHKFVEHENDTALHAVARKDQVIVAHFLIQAGATTDALNENQYTPLMLAAASDHEGIATYLLENGAVFDFAGKDGMSALHVAAKEGHVQVVKHFIRFKKINMKDGNGRTALSWASEKGHLNVVKYLLQNGCNTTISDKEGNTSLHWAALSRNEPACALLMDYGCDVNASNSCGDTPLHLAARKDHFMCIILFLSRGANIKAVNKVNQLPAECCKHKNTPAYFALSLNYLLKDVMSNFDHEHEKILHSDISLGKEFNAIPCVNGVDNEMMPSNFQYVTKNIMTCPVNINQSITSVQSCRCEGDCTTRYCACAQISFQCWYDKDGHLLDEFNMLEPPMIFECNSACSCRPSICLNRRVQKGTKCRLQLFRTKGKGWGVRTLKDIPRGTFMCEYVGELITDHEADERENDTYLFDLENKDEETYCLDAKNFGNISRFINHLCEPNVVPVKVYVDHRDLSFPCIAFFSTKEIKKYEEIGFDYGEKFWSVKYKWQTCNCGAATCKYSKVTVYETLAHYYQQLKEEHHQALINHVRS